MAKELNRAAKLRRAVESARALPAIVKSEDVSPEIGFASEDLSSLLTSHTRLRTALAETVTKWRVDARGTYMAGFYQTALDRCADEIAELLTAIPGSSS